MSDLTAIGGGAVTMTSLELVDFINGHRRQQAELAGAEFPSTQHPTLLHKNFLAKVPEVLGAETSAKFSADLPDRYGRPRKGYRFPKRESCLMAMSYSYELQAAVFDHMTALEQQLAAVFTVPQTRAEALRLAADLEEQNAQLLLENQQKALRIESMESIFQAGMTPTQFCKRLNGVNTQQVNGALLAIGWIYDAERDPERSAKYRVSSKARDKYLTEGVISIEKEGGSPFVKYTLVLLQKGAARLHELYLQEALPMKADWDGKFTHAKFALGGRQ